MGALLLLVKSESIWTINVFMIDCTTEQSRQRNTAPFDMRPALT